MPILIRWEAKTGETGNEVVADKAAGDAKLEQIFQQYGGLFALKAYNIGAELDSSAYLAKYSGDPDFDVIPGLVDLPTDQAEIFSRVYRRHIKAMGAAARVDYMPGQIQRVGWDPITGTVIVTFMNGAWFHYDTNGTWW